MKIFNRILAKINKNVFWSSVITLVSGNFIAQILGVLTTPIVSRLYDSKAFGEFAILVSTSLIIGSIVGLGLNSAVMVPKDDEESNDVFLVAFSLSLGLATLILIIFLTLSPLFHFFQSGKNYFLSCLLVYIFVIINSLKGLLSIYVNRKKLNKVLFYNSLIGALVTLIITIPLGLLKLGSVGLVIANIIATLFSIIQMLYHANPFHKIPDIPTIKRVLKGYRDFIKYQYPSNIVGNISIQLPTQAFSGAFGNANLGAYTMVEKLIGIPSRLIGAPINTIYFRTASEYYKEGKNLADFTLSLITKIMLVAFLPIVFVVLWGEQLFTWVLGESWRSAGSLASFLILLYVFIFCQNCTSYCRVAIGRQQLNLYLSILRLLVVGLAIIIGIFIFGDFKSTIIIFTLASTVFLAIDMAFNFYCMGKYWFKYSLFALIYISIVILLWFL